MSQHVECHRCGYGWDYTGNSEYYASCPKCKTSVPLVEDENARTATASGADADGQQRKERVDELRGRVKELEETAGQLQEAIEEMTKKVTEIEHRKNHGTRVEEPRGEAAPSGGSEPERPDAGDDIQVAVETDEPDPGSRPAGGQDRPTARGGDAGSGPEEDPAQRSARRDAGGPRDPDDAHGPGDGAGSASRDTGGRGNRGRETGGRHGREDDAPPEREPTGSAGPGTDRRGGSGRSGPAEGRGGTEDATDRSERGRSGDNAGRQRSGTDRSGTSAGPATDSDRGGSASRSSGSTGVKPQPDDEGSYDYSCPECDGPISGKPDMCIHCGTSFRWT